MSLLDRQLDEAIAKQTAQAHLIAHQPQQGKGKPSKPK
jgi:hypothetical protein